MKDEPTKDWDEEATRTVHGDSANSSGSKLDLGALLASRYLVTSWLGAGGMGTVYEVRDRDLDETVALKLLHPELSTQSDHRARIRSEVRLARRVSHPNVCRVHDLGQHERQLFVTMELLAGPSLRQLLRERPELRDAPLARKIDTIVQICAGLSAAHQAGVLHRDVKPDNVIVESDRVVLTDFGVASLATLAREQRLVGTPAYMAPEILGDGVCDERVDVYSTAVLSYELLAGKRPYKTPTLEAITERARAGVPIPPLPRWVADDEIRSLLDRVLARALAPEPRQRIRTIDSFAESLAHAARGDEPEWAERVAAHRKPADASEARDMADARRTLLDWSLPDALAGQSAGQSAGPNAGSTPISFEPTVAMEAATPVQERRRSEVRVATIVHLAFEVSERAQGASQSMTATQDAALSSNEPLERIVVDLGGTPLAVESSALIAVFGAPVALGDDAARAARAGLALLDAVTGGRAGVATGRILYRTTASGRPIASGDALHEAQRLSERAAPGELLASPACARHLAGRYSTTELTRASAAPGERSGPNDLDDDLGDGLGGLDDGLDDLAADGAVVGEERALLVESALEGPRAEGAHVPLLGRDDEVAALEARVRQVCENRRPGFATVISAPGMGKSRLCNALIERLERRRDIEWLRAPATPFGDNAPLGVLARAHPHWYAAAARAGLNDRHAVFGAARRWLELRASRRPVGLYVDDLHWCDDTSLEFLAGLQRALADVPVFVLAAARPSLDERTPAWSKNAHDAGDDHLLITLAPLGRPAARAIAERIAPMASDADIARVIDRADGNPFFVQELARHIHEHRDGQENLPETVEASLQSRLDRLPDGQRALCRVAAVVGVEFWREAVRAASAHDQVMSERELDAALADLEREGMVYALPPSAHVDDDRYAFHSALVRDVAYHELAPRERKKTHDAVADWLEEYARAAGTEDPALLAAIARHRDLAGAYQAAARSYRRAGEISLGMFAYRDAARMLARARTLVRQPDVGLLETLADAQMNAESIDSAEENYRSAFARLTEQAAPEKEHLEARARLCFKLGYAARQRGDSPAAVEWFERGLGLVAPEDTPLPEVDVCLVADLYSQLGWVLGYRMGENQRALRYCERAVALLEASPGHRRTLANALGALGAVYMRAGRWRDQLACNQRNLEIARDLGDLRSHLLAHCNLGIVHWSLGELERALEHTRRGLAIARRTGNLVGVGLMRNNLTGVLLEMERDHDAAAELERTFRLAERTATHNYLPETYVFAARLAARADDLERAEDHARRAVTLAAAHGSSIDEGIACRVLGAVLTLRGDPAGARDMLDRAYRYLSDADVYEYARTQAAEARLLRAYASAGEAGESDRERARELRQEAGRVFRELGAARELEVLERDGIVR